MVILEIFMQFVAVETNVIFVVVITYTFNKKGPVFLKKHGVIFFHLNCSALMHTSKNLPS